jgi:hypothetical protein
VVVPRDVLLDRPYLQGTQSEVNVRRGGTYTMGIAPYGPTTVNVVLS